MSPNVAAPFTFYVLPKLWLSASLLENIFSQKFFFFLEEPNDVLENVKEQEGIVHNPTI